jgi:hypothetical protein
MALGFHTSVVESSQRYGKQYQPSARIGWRWQGSLYATGRIAGVLMADLSGYKKIFCEDF